MALISCPECGKEVSDKAVSCPNCGMGIAETTSGINNGVTPAQQVKASKNRKIKILPIAVAILLLLGVGFASYYLYKEQEKKEAENLYKSTFSDAVKSVSIYAQAEINIINRIVTLATSNNAKLPSTIDYPADLKRQVDLVKEAKKLTGDYIKLLDNPPEKYLEAYKNLRALLREVDEMYKLNSTTGYNEDNYMDSVSICLENFQKELKLFNDSVPEGSPKIS